MICKDCDRETLIESGNELLKTGWDWLDLVEGPDGANGWRCPECVKRWNEIVESAAEARH
jgi:hypothetical protein